MISKWNQSHSINEGQRRLYNYTYHSIVVGYSPNPCLFTFRSLGILHNIPKFQKWQIDCWGYNLDIHIRIYSSGIYKIHTHLNWLQIISRHVHNVFPLSPHIPLCSHRACRCCGSTAHAYVFKCGRMCVLYILAHIIICKLYKIHTPSMLWSAFN